MEKELDGACSCHFRDVVSVAISAVRNVYNMQDVTQNDIELRLLYESCTMRCTKIDFDYGSLQKMIKNKNTKRFTCTWLVNFVNSYLASAHHSHHEKNCEIDLEESFKRLAKRIEEIKQSGNHVSAIFCVGKLAKNILNQKVQTRFGDIVLMNAAHPSSVLFHTEDALDESGKIVLEKLRSINRFKTEFTAGIAQVIKSMYKLDNNSVPASILLNAFESCTYYDVTNKNMNMIMSTKRRRFWTKPPRQIVTRNDQVFDTWNPNQRMCLIFFFFAIAIIIIIILNHHNHH